MRKNRGWNDTIRWMHWIISQAQGGERSEWARQDAECASVESIFWLLRGQGATCHMPHHKRGNLCHLWICYCWQWQVPQARLVNCTQWTYWKKEGEDERKKKGRKKKKKNLGLPSRFTLGWDFHLHKMVVNVCQFLMKRWTSGKVIRYWLCEKGRRCNCFNWERRVE